MFTIIFNKFYGMCHVEKTWIAHYAFDPTKRCPWLQKICFSILKRLGAYAHPSGSDVFALEGDRLIDLILQQEWNLEEYHCQRFEAMVIGPRQVTLIAHQAYEGGYLEISLDQPFVPDHLFGMRVLIVPWFDGVLLLPKVS
jgi:hypothetical protein